MGRTLVGVASGCLNDVQDPFLVGVTRGLPVDLGDAAGDVAVTEVEDDGCCQLRDVPALTLSLDLHVEDQLLLRVDHPLVALARGGVRAALEADLAGDPSLRVDWRQLPPYRRTYRG